MDSENRSIIVNFPLLTADVLKELSTALGLCMDVAELRILQKYFLTEARHDPTAEELQFFDRLIAENRAKAGTSRPSDFQTDDETIAGTFADLMALRAKIEPDHSSPLSFGEICVLTKKISETFVKDVPPCGIAFSASGYHRLDAALAHVEVPFGTSDSTIGISRPSPLRARGLPQNGDAVYAILSEGPSSKQAEMTLARLCRSLSFRVAAKKVIPVYDESLISALAGAKTGMEIEMSRLSGRPATESDLTKENFGLLFIAEPATTSDLILDSLDLGLRPRKIGRVTEEGSLVFRFENKVLPLPLSFLGSLFSAHTVGAISGRGETSSENVFTDRRVTTEDRNTYHLRRIVNSCEDPYADAYHAICEALAWGISRGNTLSDLRLTVCVTLPQSEEPAAVGDSLSLLLGIFRAITEWQIPLLDFSLKTGDDRALVLYAIAPLPEIPVPDSAHGNGTQLRCLAPSVAGSGLTAPDDFRRMADYVRHFIGSGTIVSARPINGNIARALGEMSAGKDVVPGNPAFVSSFVPHGSLLVEVREPIEGVCVARLPEETAETENGTEAE